MSLDFTKVTYVDGETVIGADNLNDMQDALLDLDDNKVEKEQGKGLSTNDYTDTDKDKVDDAYVVPEGGIPKSALSDAVQTSLGKADTALQEDDLEDLTEEVSDLKSAKAPAIYDTASGTIAHFEDGADGLPVKKLTVNIEPVQSGTGDPSPDNVRPISGWTGCNIVHGGIGDISFTPNEAIDGSGNIVDSSGGGYSELISASPADDAVVINNISAGQKRIRVHAYDASGVWIRQVATINILAGDPVGFYKIAMSLANTEKYLRISTGNLATTKLVTVGHQIPITFPDSAGTVYGGTLDVTNGVLTVDMAMVDLGSLAWSAANETNDTSSGGLTSTLKKPSSNSKAANMICSAYQVVARNNIAEKTILANTGGAVIVRDSSYAGMTGAQVASALSGVQLVYELATPIEITITPTQITTLLGTNNIWADCGPVSVDYPADTKLYIERINAPTDDDMTADTQIDSGKYFLIGNTLYLSTTVIPAGDTIIPGTNCTKTNLAAALNALNA